MERFWNPEKLNTPTHGWREMNVNMLTKADAPFNDVVGTYTLRGFLVKVTKAEGPPEGVWLKPEDFKPWLPAAHRTDSGGARMKHGFVIDLDRCIGCKGCQVACKQENGVALGANRTLVRTVGPMGSYPDVQMYFLPTPCQQCADPPCVQVCPTGACWQNREEGVVLIDREQCIGCRSCGEALPLPGQYV